MKAILPLALVALATAATAQQPAPRPVGQPTGATPAAPVAPRKIAGLSDEGNALYAKVLGPRDPQLVQIAQQQRQVQNQLVSLAMGATVDVDKLAGVLAKRDALLLQFRTRQNELTLDMLRQMTEQDRGVYLRAVMTPQVPPAR
jgi:hypothetical protein